MKTKFVFLTMLLIPGFLIAQKGNPNTLTVKVDSEEMVAQPRKVKIGGYVYFTGNNTKPDRMLRILLLDFSGDAITESGKYLIIGENNAPSKKQIKEENLLENYKGVAVIRYVIETKSPRMAYHVGDSWNNEESLTVNNTGDGFLEISFAATLNGTHWKEKGAATVFGGIGRLKDKVTDKAFTAATGFDSDIDPERNGYKKQPETDKIILTNGIMKVKFKD